MKPQNSIQDELKQLGIQLPVSVKTPMSMPSDYFENLSNSIKDELKMEQFLDKMPKSMPFDLPKAYFETFEAELNTQVHLESISKNIPFELPHNYFDNLSREIQEKINETQAKPAEIRPFRNRYANLAIAATLLMFVSIGFSLINQEEKVNVAQQLNVVSDVEIQTYIQSHQSEFNTDLTIERIEDEATIDLQKLEKDIFKSQLQNVSDEELATYL